MLQSATTVLFFNAPQQEVLQGLGHLSFEVVLAFSHPEFLSQTLSQNFMPQAVANILRGHQDLSRNQCKSC